MTGPRGQRFFGPAVLAVATVVACSDSHISVLMDSGHGDSARGDLARADGARGEAGVGEARAADLAPHADLSVRPDTGCVRPTDGCFSGGSCMSGEACTVELGSCGPDPCCPTCDVCYGKCVPRPSLSATFVDLYVWANLMPIVAPDPTHANVKMSFTNQGTSDVTGVKLINAALTAYNSPTSKAHPLVLQPASGFTGVVPAGQTQQADFTHTPSTTQTPVPFPCGTQVQVRTEVSSSAGALGPLLSKPVTFDCAY